MVTAVFFILRKCFLVAVFNDVKFATNNRFDAFVFRCLGNKIKNAEHITVVCNSYRGHTVGGCFFEQFGDRRRAVEERILGMAMEM